MISERKRHLLSFCTHLELHDSGALDLWYNAFNKVDEDEEFGRRIDKTHEVDRDSPFGNVTHLSLCSNLPWQLVRSDGWDWYQASLQKEQRNVIRKLFHPSHLCVNFTHENLYNWPCMIKRIATSNVQEMVDEMLEFWRPESLTCHGITIQELPGDKNPPCRSLKYTFKPVNEDLLSYVHERRSRIYGANQRISEIRDLAEMEWRTKDGTLHGTQIELVDFEHCLDPTNRVRESLLDGLMIRTHEDLVTKLKEAIADDDDDPLEGEGSQSSSRHEQGLPSFESRIKLTTSSISQPCICCGRV